VSKAQFGPTAEGHVRNVLSMNKEKLDSAINIILKAKSKTGISPLTIIDVLAESGYDIGESKSLGAVIYNLALMQKSGEVEEFYDYVKQKFPNDFKRVDDLVKKIKPIIDEVTKARETDRLSTFGIPHLSELDLVTDYRILNINNKRELVPVVICKLVIHEHVSDEDKAVNKAITFQFPPKVLDSIISDFQSVKDKIRDDQKFVSISGEFI